MSESKFLLSVIFELHPKMPLEFKIDEILDAIMQYMAMFRLLSPLNQTRLYICVPGKASFLIYPLPNTSDESLT